LDRYAVFVDVGYVYAAGGNLVLDTSNRAQVSLDHAAFVQRLHTVIDDEYPRSGDFLRIYWYDAAPRGIAQPEHDSVASLPGVKIRLGRLTRFGQKGVDALVLRDMMRLSSEHAISTAFLLTGDEDLRQAVIEAQDYGVKVILFGIEATLTQNQAESLIQEADELRVLDYSELEGCFTKAFGGAISIEEGFDAYGVGAEVGEEWALTAPAEEIKLALSSGRLPGPIHFSVIRRLLEAGDLPRSAQLPDFVLTQARDGFLAAVQRLTEPTAASPEVDAVEETPPAAYPIAATRPPEEPAAETPESVPDAQAWAFQEGAAFGRAWVNELPQEEVRYVRGNFPFLPRDIDVELLRRLIREMDLPPGSLIDDVDRKAARAGFWQALGMELDLGRPRIAARFDPIPETDPFSYGRAFGVQWASRSDPAEVERARNLLEKRIGLPSDADAVLLRMAAGHFGDPVPVDIRHRLRDGFREAIESA
jgi:uncharacterized LabA/DUF88 family protein